MKVLIVIGSPGLGGAERVSFNLAEWLNRKQVPTSLVALSGAKGKSYPTEGCDYVELNSSHIVLALRKEVKRKKPDIVLTMCTPMCVYTVPALAGLGIKHVVSERNDPAHFAGRTTTRIIARALMKLADGYVFQTRDAQEFYGGNIAKRSVIIPNPLFNIENMPDEAFGGYYKKTIVTVGRLNKQKNQKMLIEAFSEIHKQYPEYKLIVYGEGPERAGLEETIRTLKLQECCFMPGTTNNLLEEIRDSSLFVLPSNFEGMPNALMEAMALGLPCISTDCPCGGPRELIRDRENGLLISVDDKEALVTAMEKMISDRNMALRMGKNALAIRETHSMDGICQRWLEYFKHVVEE